MTDFKWSRDLGATVITQDSLPADDALWVLAYTLLGDEYSVYDNDPSAKTEEEEYATIVHDILSKYTPKRKALWWTK